MIALCFNTLSDSPDFDINNLITDKCSNYTRWEDK